MKLTETVIDNVVIGSGAAGFDCALRLQKYFDNNNVAIITENVKSGTSRNTGSDKQTYYKLGMAGDDPDSVGSMAENLFAGGCVDGDMALCEAALSARGFFNLVELGVPFPCTEFSEYMGYKTDHDHSRRATSAGPYTSKLMTQVLEKQASRTGLKIFNNMQAVKLLVHDKRVHGVLTIDLSLKHRGSYHIFWVKNVILATGGPAGMYRDSVYPKSQIGSTGMAFEAGVAGKNLTEWQFGMASISPRWNVSGTYMQVIPRFISIDSEGNEYEFLGEHFSDYNEMLNMIFLKGYQWPFDVNKIYGNSSTIDLLVYRETIIRGKKVYLDFTKNPMNKEIAFDKLSNETFEYLKNANVCFGTSIQRLQKMNAPAVSFYLDHGVDLKKDLLEIAICVQHNNGGLSTNANWETDIKNLYAVGEVNGSHGVTRPGGSALNAGQAGAIRAAESIFLSKSENDKFYLTDEIKHILRQEVKNIINLPKKARGNIPVDKMIENAERRMSTYAGMVRSREGLKTAIDETDKELKQLLDLVKAPDKNKVGKFYQLRDILISQKVYLSAMLNYLETGAKSRGSCLYTEPDGKKPNEKMPDLYKCNLDKGEYNDLIQEVRMDTDWKCEFKWRKRRMIPKVDYFFENQWNMYRDRFNL